MAAATHEITLNHMFLMKKTPTTLILLIAIPFSLMSCKPAARAVQKSNQSKETGKAIGKTIGAGSKAYNQMNDKEDEQ
jgi:hypothetical protein